MKSKERLAQELLDNIDAAVTNCEVLQLLTGDDDFKLLSMLLRTALIGKAHGDITEMMLAIAGVIDKKIMAGRDAVEDVLEDPRFAPSCN